MMISFIISFAYIIIFFSILGICLRWNNIIVLVICLELLLLAVALLFLCFSYLIDDIVGHICYIYLIVLAGVEASIGLSIIIVYYRLRGIISIYFLSFLKG